MYDLHISSYEDLFGFSVDKYEVFWEKVINRLGIIFKKPYSVILDASGGIENPVWLQGALMNITDSCFQADENKTAVVFKREGEKIIRVSYGELRQIAHTVSSSLRASGARPGDAIAIDMPLTPEAVAIYLGTIISGCVVVSVPDSLAAEEAGLRLRMADAKMIFTQDFVSRSGKKIPLYEKILPVIKIPAVVVRTGDSGVLPAANKDLLWEDFLLLSPAGSLQESFSALPGDHTNILFSSGTTGEPKAIPWTHTTPVKCASDGFFHHNIQPDDVIAWPTSLGWMMGPWLIYAGFINKASLALYEGSPAERDYGLFVQEAGVTMFGVVPSLVKAWRSSSCMENIDWSRIKRFSSTGECSNADDMLYLMSLAGYKPVIEYCGGTEIGGGYITGTMVQPASPATFTTPALGTKVYILDQLGKAVRNGEIFIRPPSIGLSAALLKGDHHKEYFSGTPVINGISLRRHGDQIEEMSKGYFRAHGRVDDTMNIGGIKVSSVEIERALQSMAGIKETAAIAVPEEDKGPDRLIIYAVPSDSLGSNDPDVLKADMQKTLSKKLNPLFRIHAVVLIHDLPRTPSNKIIRKELRTLYRKTNYNQH